MLFQSFIPLFQPLMRSSEDVKILRDILDQQHAILKQANIAEWREATVREAQYDILKQVEEEVANEVRRSKLPWSEVQLLCYDFIETLKARYDPDGQAEWRWKKIKEEDAIECRRRAREEQKRKEDAENSRPQSAPPNSSPSKRKGGEIECPEQSDSKKLKRPKYSGPFGELAHSPTPTKPQVSTSSHLTPTISITQALRPSTPETKPSATDRTPIKRSVSAPQSSSSFPSPNLDYRADFRLAEAVLGMTAL
ncbi:MAG: hypothetical protein Q9227_000660 [Pyrenula ochraceoflavens]